MPYYLAPLNRDNQYFTQSNTTNSAMTFVMLIMQINGYNTTVSLPGDISKCTPTYKKSVGSQLL